MRSGQRDFIQKAKKRLRILPGLETRLLYSRKVICFELSLRQEWLFCAGFVAGDPYGWHLVLLRIARITTFGYGKRKGKAQDKRQQT